MGSPRRPDAPRRTHRRLLATAGLALAVAGCGAGQLAQTSEVTSAVDGASGQAGSIALRNVAVAYPDGGRYRSGDPARVEFVVVNEGADDDTLVDVRTTAAERATITAGPAAIVTPTPSGTDSASATPSGTPTGTPSGTASATATSSSSATATASPTVTATASPTVTATASPTPEPSARIQVPAGGLVAFRADGPAVTLVGLAAPLQATQVVEITFVFERAGEVTLRVPIAAAAEEVSPPETVDVAEPEGEG